MCHAENLVGQTVTFILHMQLYAENYRMQFSLDVHLLRLIKLSQTLESFLYVECSVGFKNFEIEVIKAWK